MRPRGRSTGVRWGAIRADLYVAQVVMEVMAETERFAYDAQVAHEVAILPDTQTAHDAQVVLEAALQASTVTVRDAQVVVEIMVEN